MNELILNKNKNIGARNLENNLPLNIDSTSKPLIKKNLKEIVDLYEVYREEYKKCNKYRVTVTIKPYCTNVLFNVCTEIVKNEGDDSCEPVYDNENLNGIDQNDVYGKYNHLRRYYMVSNTEYSSPEIGYTYYPGYDIFDNHTLRSLSFRPIMFVDSVELFSTRERFNTIRDYMRTKEGKTINIFSRFSYEDVENNNKLKMHIYEHSNLLPFFDGSSALANLYVENGWYGFYNYSAITDKTCENNVNEKQHVFSHTINDSANCRFIDMFPDRSYYSFIPKYNQFRHRYEKNWDIFLTYPWKNFYNHNLVNNVKRLDSWISADKKTFALSTLRVTRTNVSTNRKTMLFRTFCKHNLSINDKIVVYLSKNYGENYVKLPKEYTIDYLGDEDGNNREYFFGISSKMFLNDVFEGEIEDLFYQIPIALTPQHIIVNQSERINDIPDSYNGLEIIRVFKYEQQRASQNEYTDEETFDTLPKTINEYSNINIRVWDGTYSYWRWYDNNSEYLISEQNLQIEYGEWNTYNDVPQQETVRYIRVKNFLFYHRIDTTYEMKKNIDIDDIINEQFENNKWHIRFAKVVNGVKCKYYIRQFRKIPNLKNSSEPLPENICKNEDKFLSFIEENASNEEGNMLTFDSETYKLAFSKTLYGDDIAQVTFLDTLDIENLKDNLGRPITEIYSTVVKRNKGYKEWYEFVPTEAVNNNEAITSSDMEYSRCFGSLTTGLEYLDLRDSFDESSDIRKLKGNMSSIGSIYRMYNEVDLPLTLEDWDEDNVEKEITENNDVFFGDVVEYNPIKCKETVLSDACFRFNTAQREVGRDGEGEDYNFVFHELTYDDFDPSDNRPTPFLLTEYMQWDTGETLNEAGEDMLTEIVSSSDQAVTIRRPEGYYYKPHTKIQLLKFSDNILQGSHRTLHIKECIPLQAEGMYIKITTRTMHGVNTDDTLYICFNNNWIKTSVASIIDSYRFTISPISKDSLEREGLPYLDWVEVCKGINSGRIKLRVKNEEIPDYADKIDENIFLWRTVVNPVELSENDKLRHPFSNNCFYVDSQVNLYLRRQDPDAINGLYYSGNLPDITGQIYSGNNNEYKSEKETIC